MKKNKINKPFSQGSKISDYFSKKPGSSEPADNKRKRDPPVLNSVTNFPQAYELSPNHKKVKQEDHVSSLVEPQGTFISSFKVITPKKGIKPSTSMKTPSSAIKRSSSSKKSTPQSGKKGSPKKLFEKSPRKLEEFNAEIMKNFFQISPSTSNQKVVVQTTPTKVCLSSPIAKIGTPNRIPNQNGIRATASPKSAQKLSFLKSINENREVDKIKMELDDYFDDDFDLLKFEEVLESLDLALPQHCKIEEIERTSKGVVLKLKSTKNGIIAHCTVEGFWACSTPFKPGNTIFICAEKNNNTWLVNNDTGWLVFEPDLLIPCTTVMGSLFCKRKVVLSERHRGFDTSNRIMTIGVLAHTFLQQALKNKLKTMEEIKMLLCNILQTKDTVKKLYETNLTREEAESELQVFVPKLVSFIREYVTHEAPPEASNWQGKICAIDDIEETIWCQEMGTKGKIDVSLQTQDGLMPLELKTGRASVSFEHQGQVILYIMMMKKLGLQVSSGLLLYLREGVLKEITPTPQEQRDILMLRNELAYFLTKKIPDDIKTTPVLPEPLNNHRICSKCPYNVICTSYLKYENYEISKNKSIQDVQATATAHLTQSHLDYFLLWSNLLNMEEDSKRLFKSAHEIYTVPPAKREVFGQCISNVKITNVDSEENGLYEHTFEKADPNLKLISSEIVQDNYVIVSTDSRPAVAAGFVAQTSSSKIVLFLDRNLETKYQGQNFHLDTYNTNVTYAFNMSSLALLLENTQRAAQLRDIIVDKKLPTFVSKLPAVVAKRGAVILKRLNQVQQKAVLKALCANDFLLIKGMPGTGKSATIVALIQLLLELNKTVLVTSHTHSAIDNICIRLQKRKVDFLRLGSESKIEPCLKSNTEPTILKNCTTPQEMEEAYNKYNIVAVTCLGSGHPLLSRRVFDVCIVDESTQVVQTSVIKALYAAKTFVLIGDPNQLAPVVQNVDAAQAGMSESLFERLENCEGTIALNLNYRMNKTITNLANVLTYNGELKTGSEEVAKRTLEIPSLEAVQTDYKHHSWLLKALKTSLESAVQIIDTGPVWDHAFDVKWHLKNTKYSDSQNCINVHEVSIVVMLIKALLKGGVHHNDIGVIATYRAQVAQISTFLQPLEVDVSTVDQFQGRDKSVIVFSCTKSTTSSGATSKSELLEDKRRLTVAITRAKRKLLIVGDVSTLERFSTFQKILPALKNNIIKFDSKWDLMKNC